MDKRPTNRNKGAETETGTERETETETERGPREEQEYAMQAHALVVTDGFVERGHTYPTNTRSRARGSERTGRITTIRRRSPE